MWLVNINKTQYIPSCSGSALPKMELNQQLNITDAVIYLALFSCNKTKHLEIFTVCKQYMQGGEQIQVIIVHI